MTDKSEARRFEDVIARHIGRLLGQSIDRHANHILEEQARESAISMVRDLIATELVPMPEGPCDRRLAYGDGRCGLDPYHYGMCTAYHRVSSPFG